MEFMLKMVSARLDFSCIRMIIVDCSHNIHLYHTGLVNGYPRFVEQNKVDGHPYKEVIPAEIIYCSDIGSWVFWHPNIKTSPPNKPEYEVCKALYI